MTDPSLDDLHPTTESPWWALRVSADVSGEAEDLAALYTLLSIHPHLSERPWWVGTLPSGLMIFTHSALSGVDDLHDYGLPLSKVHVLEGEAHISTSGKASMTIPWGSMRCVRDLVTGLRPLAIPGDPVVAEACLVMPVTGPSAQITLTRLLRLGRADVQVSQWQPTADASGQIAFRLVDPPLYLMMRARDEDEGITAYVRHEHSPLWVEWGHRHPLPDLAASRLGQHGQSAWVDADGTWHRRPADWPERSIYAVVEAALPAHEVPLTAEPQTTDHTRFVVQLGLEAAPVEEPESWLLTLDEVMSLESLVEDSTGALLNRITLSRLHGPDGPVHLLRVRGGHTDRLGTRIADILGLRGFTPLPGTEQILVPVGKRLAPAMRLEELRPLLGLQGRTRVIVQGPSESRSSSSGSQAGGLQLFRIPEVDEIALTHFVDYVATSHRVALDALFERSVFAFESIEVDRPPKAGALSPPPPPPPRLTAPRRRHQLRATTRQKPEAEVAQKMEQDWSDIKVLQSRVREIEASLLAGEGNTDLWREMAHLKGRLDEPDDAAACMEIALFHAGVHCFAPGSDEIEAWAEPLRDLVGWRLKKLQLDNTTETLVDLATLDLPQGPEAAFLGARLLSGFLTRETLFDGLDQRAQIIFSEAGLTASRRLQWLVLAALHFAHDDALGLTRAKEALLGALNTQGLREGADIPRFIRYALALEGGDQAIETSAAMSTQAHALHGAWALMAPQLEELDVHSAFARAVFSVGFARLGLTSDARRLAAAVEEELPVHDRATGTLLRLYLARSAAVGLENTSDPEQLAEARALWKSEVSDLTAGLNTTESRALHVVRRWSRWLALDAPEEDVARTYLGADALRILDHAQQQPKQVAEVMGRLLGGNRLSSLSGAQEAVERCINLALSTGQEQVIDDTVQVVIRHLNQHFGTPRARMAVQGRLIAAAAVIDEGARVGPLIEDVLTQMPHITAVGDLLLAVGPALEALRRVGVTDQVEQFLAGLREVADRGHRLSAQVAGIAAEGYWMIQEADVAREILEQTLEAISTERRDHVARFEAGSAFTDAVRPWPSTERALWLTRLLSNLDVFRDSFTSSRYFEALKILMLERIVDTTTDTVSFASGRVRSWLEQEEQIIRRRIIADWRLLSEG
ncbi:MAG: hypothetical protein ACE366_07780 [Bradymonadia bacterium]